MPFFRSGIATTARSLSEVVDQLQEQLRETQEQLRAANEQNAFNVAHYEEQIKGLLRELIAAKYEIAKRNFAAAPSPSPSRQRH
jgi:hypothetical protein